LFAGTIAPAGSSSMRRGLSLRRHRALAVAGLWYGKSFAPCSRPMAALAGFGLKPAVACPAPAADEAEAPRVVAPPAVTVIAAKTESSSIACSCRAPWSPARRFRSRRGSTRSSSSKSTPKTATS